MVYSSKMKMVIMLRFLFWRTKKNPVQWRVQAFFSGG